MNAPDSLYTVVCLRNATDRESLATRRKKKVEPDRDKNPFAEVAIFVDSIAVEKQRQLWQPVAKIIKLTYLIFHH